MSSNNDLNPIGQSILAVSATWSLNYCVHPICTIKNRVMLKEPAWPPALPKVKFGQIRAFYSGVVPLCIAESVYNAATYVLKDDLERKKYSPMEASTLAGIIASPSIAVGEAVMVKKQANRQVKDVAFLDKMWSSMRPSGIVSTILRDVPFTVAVLGGAPMIERSLSTYISNDVGRQFFAGTVAGILSGAATTPFDTIKTLVQGDDYTLSRATRIFAKSLQSREGRCQFMREVGYRSLYVGLSVALLHVFNKQIPKLFSDHFPKLYSDYFQKDP